MRTLFILICLMVTFSSFAQNTGILSGTVTEKETQEPLPFVKIILEQSGVIISTTTSDFDGKYKLYNIKADTFDIRVSFIGYETHLTKGVYISPNQITTLQLELENSGKLLNCVEVTSYQIQTNIYSRAKLIGKNDGKSNFRQKHKKDINTESYSKIESNKFKKVKNDPLSTFSIDIDKAAYSNSRRFITSGNLPPADVVRIEEMINYFQYDYAPPTDNTPFSIHTEYTDCAWNKAHKLVQIGLKGKSIEMENAPASNLVFLIDVSGSMRSANKLDLLKTGFELLVDQMREKDRISVVVYAGAAGVVLNPTSGNKKEIIKSALNKLTAGGSTAGGEGIELAYAIAKKNFVKNGNNRVIGYAGICTVGVFSCDNDEKHY